MLILISCKTSRSAWAAGAVFALCTFHLAAQTKASDPQSTLRAQIKAAAAAYIQRWTVDFEAQPAGKDPVLSALTTPAYKNLDSNVQNQVFLNLVEAALRTMPLDRAARVDRELREYEKIEAGKGCQVSQSCFIKDVLQIHRYDSWTAMAVTYEGLRVLQKSQVNIDSPSAHLILGQLTGEKEFPTASAATVARASRFFDAWKAKHGPPEVPEDLEVDPDFRRLSAEIKSEVFGLFVEEILKPARRAALERLKEFSDQDVQRAQVTAAKLMSVLTERRVPLSETLSTPEVLALREPDLTVVEMVFGELAGREVRIAFRRHLELGRSVRQAGPEVAAKATQFFARWRERHGNNLYPEVLEEDVAFRQLDDNTQMEVFSRAVDRVWAVAKTRIAERSMPIPPESASILRAPAFADLSESLESLTTLQVGESLMRMARDAHRAEIQFGPNHPDRARTLASLAALYDLNHDYSRAEPLYRAALSIVDPPDATDFVFGSWDKRDVRKLFAAATGRPMNRGNPDAPGISYALAYNLWSQHKSQETVAALRRAARAEQSVFDRVLVGSSISQKQVAFDQLTRSLDAVLSFHARVLPDDPSALDLALTVLLQRKGRLLDTLTDEFTAVHETLDPDVQREFDELRDVQQVIKELVSSGATDSNPEFRRLRNRQEELESDISNRSREFRRRAEPIEVSDVKAALPSDTALVEFARYREFDPLAKLQWGQARYSAYILSKNAEPAWVDLGPAAIIDTMGAQFAASLGSPENDAVTRRLGRELDERLMQPVRRVLQSHRNLLVAPDGILSLIPFGALVAPDGKYLLTSYEFTYLSAGRDVLRLQERVPARQTARFFANPTSQSTVRPPIPQLPETEEEALSIAALLRDARVLQREQASKANLTKVTGPSVLHMATHGFFSPGFPDRGGDRAMLRSGLMLSDGIFTAAEAATLDLSGTDLVVLSACETGIGEIRTADGVSGLRRAFVLAGARSQLLTLWMVDSETTRDFMIDFYRRLLNGDTKAAALLSAQRSLAARLSPYYWAPFILSGDGGPLHQ